MGGWWFIGHWRLPDRYKALHLVTEDANGLPTKFRRKTVPKIWYFMVNSGAVFFLPFLGIYWRGTLHFTTAQIGLLQALRPWISALAGNVLMTVADSLDIHYVMLILTYCGTIICRGLITIETWNFAMMLLLTLVMESSVTSMSVLVDATVVAGSVKDGTYGRSRLWASVGWGAFAPIAGVILTKFGIHTCLMIFAAIYATASIPTFLIPAGLLASKNQHLRKTTGSEPSTSSSNSGSGSGCSSNNSSTKDPTSATNEGDVMPSPGGDNGTTNTTTGATQLPVSVTAGTTLSRRTSRRSSQHSGQHVITVEVDAGSRRTSTQQTVAAAAAAGDGTMVILEMPADTPPGPTDSLKFQDIDEIDPKKEVWADIEAAKEFKSDGKGKQVAIVANATTAAAGSISAKTEQKESIWLGLRTLFSDIYVLTFMFLAFLMGIGNGFIGYLFLLLTDLGGNGTLLGLCLAMNCVGEVPLFYYSGAIIKRIGVTMSFNLAMASYILRVGCYALLPWYPSLWIALPVELLQGMTFGLAYSAGTVHCRRIAPRYLRSTVQSIFSGLYTGIGAGIGGLAGGMIYDKFGGQKMYIVATVVLTAGWAAANFTNLIQYLRKGVRGGFKRAKRVGHHMRKGLTLMATGGSSGSATSSSDGGSASGVSDGGILDEEGEDKNVATVPSEDQKMNASSMV